MTDKFKLKNLIDVLDTIVLPLQSSDVLEHLNENLQSLIQLQEQILENYNNDCISALRYLNTLHFFAKAKKFFKNAISAYRNIFTASEDGEMPLSRASKDVVEMDFGYEIGQDILYILLSIINITDMNEESQKSCCEDGFITFLFMEFLPLLSDIKWGQKTLRQEMLERSIDIVYNCCKTPSNLKYYENANAVDILVNLRNATNHLEASELNVTALLTLGYLLDESNNDKILSDKGTIRMLIRFLKLGLENSDHSYLGFHSHELAIGLSHIAGHDENKTKIIKENGIDVLASYLERALNDEEQISCCNALWMLCFCSEGRSCIEKNSALIKKLEELTHSKKEDVSKIASGVFWQLKHTEGDQLQRDGRANHQHNLASNRHIMLSYQWENQQMVKRIADYLKSQGYRIWIDINNMQGCIMEAMAQAVEDADIIIVCVSRQYKNSPNTRAEADYAFQLKKCFIPVIMEEGYRPDGWLGMLLGSNLWIKFTDDGEFSNGVIDLCKTIGNRCLNQESDVIIKEAIVENTCQAVIDDGSYFGHHPLRATDATDTGNTTSSEKKSHKSKEKQISNEKEKEIAKWSNDDVVAWLQKTGMSRCIKKDTIKKLTGIHLIMLHKLRDECPKFYFTNVKSQVGISDMLDLLTFTYHLENMLKS